MGQIQGQKGIYDMSTSKGWIKLHRQIQDCSLWREKPYDKARCWVDLLLMACHSDTQLIIDGKTVDIAKGSFFTSTVRLADKWGWERTKLVRFLKWLEQQGMITTSASERGTIITITRYEEYQDNGDFSSEFEAENKQKKCTTKRTSKCTTKCTTESAENTDFEGDVCTTERTTDCTTKRTQNKNDNNKNDNKKEIYKYVVDYMNEKFNTTYKSKSQQTVQHINARIKDGFTINEMKLVIDHKSKTWLYDDKFRDYLRPQTLFCGKFEGYLQSALMYFRVDNADDYYKSQSQSTNDNNANADEKSIWQ